MPVGCPGISPQSGSTAPRGGLSTTLQGILKVFQDFMPNTWTVGSGLVNRTIAGTNKLSMHATGLAIDLCLKRSPNQTPLDEKYYMNSAVEYLTRYACELGLTRVLAEFNHNRSVGLWSVSTDPNGSSRQPMSAWRREARPRPGTQNGIMHLHVEVHSSARNRYSAADVKALFLTGGVPSSVLSGSQPPNGTTTVTPGNTAPTNIIPPQVDSSGNPVGSNPLAAPVKVVKPVTDVQGWGANPYLTGCNSCGDPWAAKINTEDCDLRTDACGVISLTQCGGTGAICIEKSSGKLCTVGTAMTLGIIDFSQGVIDATFHGPNTIYALLADGRTVEGRGINPTLSPLLKFSPRTKPTQKFTNLYMINPTTIGITAVNDTGYGTGRGSSVTARATVNDVSSLTCC